MKYTVHFTMSASTTVEVDADSPDEAIEQACNEVYVSICHQCASICHQCARDMDLAGEWEPEAVTNEAGETVWEETRR